MSSRSHSIISQPKVTTPKVASRPHNTTCHGITNTDNYAWLRDPNWKDVLHDPSLLQTDIRTYLEDENAYTDDAFESLSPLREELYAEIKGRIKQDDVGLLMPDGPFVYFKRYVEGNEHAFYCRRKRDQNEVDQVLLDSNALADGNNYFKLGALMHSPDHRFLAWSADTIGSEIFTIRIRDLERNRDLPDVMPNTIGKIVWAQDSKTLFYVALDENLRPSKVLRHHIGEKIMQDTLIYEECDPSFSVSINRTQSERYIVIDVHDHQTNEIHIIDASTPDAPSFLVEPRQRGIEYNLEHATSEIAERFIILTNIGHAEDFKVMETPIDAPGAANWRELVPHRPGVLIRSHVAFINYYVRLEQADGRERIIVRHLIDGKEHELLFDEELYELDIIRGYEYDSCRLLVYYSSLTTPGRVFEYHLDTRTRIVVKEQEIPSGHNPEDYVARRAFATATDGERVPISILYRKDTPLNGSAPLFLYGYGAYGYSTAPSFSIETLSLVDRGFIYAIAHVRGGKERGYRWYMDGRLSKKINTFIDFIAVAEYLIDARYTSRGNIIAYGRSAGGMLVAASANMEPELFNGIIAEVPFVDVLNTMLSDSLPLTPPEWLEWGNPIEDVNAYTYIASYSPYDNVRANSYPHILALCSLTDPRVGYWEAAKWIAKLRATQVGEKCIFLKTNMTAGHSGHTGRFTRLDDISLILAFALIITDCAKVLPYKK